jgi:hypothetical protein
LVDDRTRLKEGHAEADDQRPAEIMAHILRRMLGFRNKGWVIRAGMEDQRDSAVEIWAVATIWEDMETRVPTLAQDLSARG